MVKLICHRILRFEILSIQMIKLIEAIGYTYNMTEITLECKITAFNNNHCRWRRLRKSVDCHCITLRMIFAFKYTNKICAQMECFGFLVLTIKLNRTALITKQSM